MYPSDGVHTEKFIHTDQMIDCNFFTRLGIDLEQASKNFPFRKISIRTGLYCVLFLIIIEAKWLFKIHHNRAGNTTVKVKTVNL